MRPSEFSDGLLFFKLLILFEGGCAAVSSLMMHWVLKAAKNIS
ncbi:hypothetical protein l11_15370 [Neisseria weaveri LMG 5135]|nr:hypothetical protein l13_16040 [Neisseria weaveri ATCC 51223]EGV36961.1 hypothetical protein l11_15370 [Neisseria weaveri LMG 5135]